MFQYCFSNKTTKPRNHLNYRAFVLHKSTLGRTYFRTGISGFGFALEAE